MKLNKIFLNNMQDYARKVMTCETFSNYIKLLRDNYFGSHMDLRIGTFGVIKESEMFIEAYDMLNATISLMELTLTECINVFEGVSTNKRFENVKSMIDRYINLNNIPSFMVHNPEAFNDETMKTNIEIDVNKPIISKKEFFRSSIYEHLVCLLKKMAYESAKIVYGYIESHPTDSEEIMNWMNECKMYMTDWHKDLVKPEKWFDTDDLLDVDVLLGSVKIFTAAKMIALLED